MASVLPASAKPWRTTATRPRASRRAASTNALPQHHAVHLTVAAGVVSSLLAAPSALALDPAALSLDLLDSTTVIAGASVAAAGGLVAAALGQGGESKKAGVIPTAAKLAWEALNADENTVLVDIRAKADSKEEGAPDVKATGKKLLSLAFTQVKKTKEGPQVVVNEKFVASFTKLKGLKEGSIIILLDKDGTQASAAAKQLLASDLAPKKVYYVKGGSDAWQAAELPWAEPPAPFQLTLPSLEMLATVSQSVQGSVAQGVGRAAAGVEANRGLIEMGLTAAASVGGAVFLITEFELLLQLVGVTAATAFLARNVLDGKLRDSTFESLKSFFADKVAADEVGDDLRKLARAVLDAPDSAAAARSIQALEAAAPVAALPAPAAAAPAAAAPAAAAAAVETPVETLEPVAVVEAAVEAVVVPPVSEAAAPAEAAEVPENAKEARAWIAGWKEGQVAAASAAVEVAEAAAPSVAEATEVPENVKEAREWIAGWKAEAAAPAAPAATEAPAAATEVPANVKEAQEWIAGWKEERAAAPAVEAVTEPAAAVSEVPENVKEAREWIAGWKAAAAAPAAPAATEVPENVKEAREWIAGWKEEKAAAVAPAPAAAAQEIKIVIEEPAAAPEAAPVEVVAPEKELQTVSA